MSSVEWNEPKDFPDELHKGKTDLSIDVLVYSEHTKEHTIGWFNFNTMSWCFLCREAYKKFKWRYFNNNLDRY